MLPAFEYDKAGDCGSTCSCSRKSCPPARPPLLGRSMLDGRSVDGARPGGRTIFPGEDDSTIIRMFIVLFGVQSVGTDLEPGLVRVRVYVCLCALFERICLTLPTVCLQPFGYDVRPDESSMAGCAASCPTCIAPGGGCGRALYSGARACARRGHAFSPLLHSLFHRSLCGATAICRDRMEEWANSAALLAAGRGARG